MRVYLVREAGTTAVHGIFWAANLDDLWITVDEMADPSCFEYAEMKRPSGMWRPGQIGGGVPAFPQWNDDDKDCEGVELLPQAILGEDLLLSVCEQASLKWRRYDYSDQGHGMVAQIKREIASEREATCAESTS